MRIDRVRRFGWLGALLAAGLSCATPPPTNTRNMQPVNGCPAGALLCGGACTDIQSNALHCGGCDRPCGTGLLCSQSVCSTSCAAGLTQCGSSCVLGPCGGTAGTLGRGGSGSVVPRAGSGGASSSVPGGAGTTGGGSGSAAPVAGGGAGAGAAGGVPAGEIGGYIESGSWRGFAWTATSASGAMISPKDFASAVDFPLCAMGNVMAGNDNVAMVGWNLNQSSVNGEPALMVSPQAAGISVGITNTGGSELRLQLQGPSGATNANDRWCAVIPGTGGFIPYDAFNTECWAGGMGTAYSGQPIVAAIVLVPGKAATAVSFDFCVTQLAEADMNGMVSQGCSLSGGTGEGTGTLSGSDTRTVTRDGRQYVVQNNVWNGNGTNQSLTLNGVSFSVSQQNNSAGTGGPPTSYPSVFIGSNFGHATSGSGLPKQVSSLTSVQTGWKWSGQNGTHNAAYDVWFSTGAGGDSGTPSGGYLMVWYFRNGGVQPLGSPSGTVSLGGKSWQVWVCGGGCQNGVPVISYVPASGSIDEWSFDLNLFIENAVDQFGVIKSNWYLSNIFAGFEIWSGGSGLRTDNFCAVVK